MPKIIRKNPPDLLPRSVENDSIDNSPPVATETCGERLAINLFDLARVDTLIRQMLFADKLDLSQAIRVDLSRMDEAAVEFTCDLLTAACCCDTVRNKDRSSGDYPTRVYLRKANGVAWTRLTHGDVLTEIENGKPVLSSKVFSLKVDPVEANPLPIKKVSFCS